MKKFLLSLLGLMSAVAFSANAAVGDSFTIGDVTYTVLTPSTVSVSDVNTSATSIELSPTVSYEGTTYSLTTIGYYAFNYSRVTSLTIPEGVTTLDDYAIYNPSNLSEINLPSTLRTIGAWALGYNKCVSISIPEGVTSIGHDCFFNCSKLTQVSLPSTLKSIGASCFYKVPIESIDLPAGLTELGAKAFLRCEKLKSAVIPEGVTVIGDGLFNGCKALTSVTLNDNITTIGDEAFFETGLSGSFTLPAALENIGSGAFAKTKITEFVVPAGGKIVKEGECVYNADKTILMAYPPIGQNTTVTVNPSCVGIGEGAFWATNVQKVTLGSKVRAIGESAFVLSPLSEINLPNSIVFIGEEAFAGTKLASVVLPENLPMLQAAAFAQSPSLTSITIPSSVSYLDIRVFNGCTALSNVYCQGAVPPVLEEIYESDENQFYQIPSTSTLHIPAGTADAYKKAGWSSNFKNVVEDMPAIAELVSADPANDSKIASFDGVSLEFASTPSVKTAYPNVLVQQGPLVAGTPNGKVISVTGWHAIISGGKGRIFPEDYDSYLEAFNLEDGKDYYITIPQGVFKTADGAINDRIVLHYIGEQPKFEPISFDPANDAIISSFASVTIKFSEKPTVMNYTIAGTKFLKGSIVDGKVQGTNAITSDFEEWRTTISNSNNSVNLWAADMDYYTAPTYLDATSDYYLVIPAKSFKSPSGIFSDEIVLHYTRKTDGIISVGSADDDAITIEASAGTITIDADTAEIYTISGAKVASVQGAASVSLPAGAYIVAAKKGAAFKNAKVIL
ncbi:MAG: leucine-rich repeat domain-containing protein [Clostridium sp.]|nr:leucine-rich repeat domain-containing protein [Clostridium sp.]